MMGLMNAVDYFMQRLALRRNEMLPPLHNEDLLTVSRDLANLAASLPGDHEDLRVVRAHLLIEELAEIVYALGRSNEIELLDGLADLTYVTAGTAVAFDLPLESGLAAVHISNLTKIPVQDRPGHPGKGADYRPPDLKAVIEAHRALKEDSPRPRSQVLQRRPRNGE